MLINLVAKLVSFLPIKLQAIIYSKVGQFYLKKKTGKKIPFKIHIS